MTVNINTVLEKEVEVSLHCANEEIQVNIAVVVRGAATTAAFVTGNSKAAQHTVLLNGAV